MSRTYIIAARRTPVAPRNTAFKKLALQDMAKPVIAQLLTDSALPASQIDELIVANAIGPGGNPARICALESDLPQNVAGLSIDRQCAGGLDAIILAKNLIQSDQCNCVVAGGVESYSRRPLRYHTFSDGAAPQAYDQAPFTPWPERDPQMPEAAHALAEQLNITQDQQDRWAIESHKRASATPPALLAAELVPIAGFHKDSFTRALSPRHCKKAKRICGTITSANMAVAADAAAFVLVVNEDIAKRSKGNTIEIVAGASLGADPQIPGLAPVQAMDKALHQSGLTKADITHAEIMEAFAAQAIACQEKAGLDKTIVNQYGGALARGHPIGASGAILATRLYHILCNQSGIGLAAIAAAGGLGTALILKKN
ncbi:MAG: thiolase family protein [Cohaesibacter sp.]|nr:thiolase family protein [Cohaesibacter sp.]MCV6603121.1 thiolase family protein [Cohaesibacter sp.]